MPTFTVEIEDTSPALVYTGNWRAGTSRDDNLADQYRESSFMVTQARGAKINFIFYGTAVGIYGARRSGHGDYHVEIDGSSFPTMNGNSDDPLFNSTMFYTELRNGIHTLNLVNDNNDFFDIDYVSFTTSAGASNEPLIVDTYQNSHSSFSYSPPASWVTPPMIGTFSGSSGQQCGLGEINIQTRKQFYRAQQILFYAGNLGPGSHTLTLQLGPGSSTDQVLAIDYVNVYTTPSLGGSSLGTSNITNTPLSNPTAAIWPSQTPFTTLPSDQAALSSSSQRIPTSVLAALAITSTVAFLALVGFAFLFRRQYRELLGLRPEPRVYNLNPGHIEPYETGMVTPFTRPSSIPTGQVYPARLGHQRGWDLQYPNPGALVLAPEPSDQGGREEMYDSNKRIAPNINKQSFSSTTTSAKQSSAASQMKNYEENVWKAMAPPQYRDSSA
ncbi:hypothetical protein B0H34DRAFT_838329 [Crassisporium funariophilum]|nr:hypothetical protein B0H34DRAFT_838329 [Crassisporium funariophilum]